MKKKLTVSPWPKKKETDKVTIMVHDFKTVLSAFDKTSKQKFSKNLIETISQSHLIDIYRPMHITTTDYVFNCSWNVYQGR